MRTVVVGAGFTGATLAERLAAGGDEVLVVDRHTYVGGAAHDYVSGGITVQAHGPHIFHTNSEKVWQYISRFGRWRPVVYKVAASVDKQLLPLPFGEVGIRRALGKQAEQYISVLRRRYGVGKHVPIGTIRRDFSDLGDFVYEKILRGYSEKHWGMKLEELPPSITDRLPIFVGDQPTYFADTYQMVPDGGYTSVITRMLAHPRIKLELGRDFHDLPARDGPVFYTGSPDEYFGEAGTLPYRTVRFSLARQRRIARTAQAELTSSSAFEGDFTTITYPSEPEYTRSTDLTRLTGEHPTDSLLVTDFPGAHVPGKTEPLYPIPLKQNVALAASYHKRAPKKVWFAGRLGSYQYLNMDQAVGQALALYERVKSGI